MVMNFKKNLHEIVTQKMTKVKLSKHPMKSCRELEIVITKETFYWDTAASFSHFFYFGNVLKKVFELIYPHEITRNARKDCDKRENVSHLKNDSI
jgi:hypothetical protein